MENKYKKYARLKAEIKEREAQLKQMELDLIDDLYDMEGYKLQTDYATFSLISYRKYRYSAKLLELEKQYKAEIKQNKKIEEANNIAEKLEDGVNLRVTLSKTKK